MAETSSPQSVIDWTEADRLSFTRRWNDANAFNLMRRNAGFKEYQTIRQRAFFYDWFDQIREVQGHEILWPAAAWIVAMQMSNVENLLKNLFIPDAMKPFAKEGNKAIFEDVFPRLADVFERGLKGKPLKGKEAENWDNETLRHEQFDVVQPIYQKHIRLTPDLKEELLKMASGSGLYVFGGLAIGGALDFKGDILKAQDRFHHGSKVVTAFYQRFKAAIDASRKRRQQAKPDPSAGGRIAFKP
ncbi:MAG: hypothetical protein KDJ31_17150 [Candidatus Competibacteraceae bacterium]|nr:hypothetical protein [Candidatus Competibacteraceae bacterium]MCB1820904.1 hypothetical protein [Candidatus Competibacteraceae bacterium]